MAELVLQPTPLEEAMSLLPELTDEDIVLYVESPLALATPQCRLAAYRLDEEDEEVEGQPWVMPGYEYLLEGDIAADAARVFDEWRRLANAPPASARERAAAVIFYATFDAFLPVGEEERPGGGFAAWGGSGQAAADANLQSASDRLARFPDRAVPSYAEQRSVRPGDVVEVMVWFESPQGPRAEARAVRVDAVEGDLLTASAVDADVVLQFRHDHIVSVRR